MTKYDRRIRALEAKHQLTGAERVFQQLIASGKCYDELSRELQDFYLQYLKLDRAAFEEVNLMVCGTLHVALEVPTGESVAEIAAEIEELFFNED